MQWTATGRAFVIVEESDPVTSCIGADTLWVDVTEGLTPAIAGDSVLCAGGSLVLRVSGGPYQAYEWLRNGNVIPGQTDSTLTVTMGGDYVVRVTTDDCSGESPPHRVDVIPLPRPSIQPAGPIELCPGDSVVLALNGNYLSQQWSTGETTTQIVVRQAGSYTVTVDSLGCPGTSEPVEVRLVAFPDTAITGASTACLGARGEYSVPANPDYTYVWTITGGTILSGAGTARVEVEWTDSNGGMLTLAITHRSSGCSVTLLLAVTIDQTLRPALRLAGPPVICSGSSLVLRAERGYLAYRWFRDGVVIAGQSSDTLLVTRAGSYSVEVTDNGGCSGVSDAVSVSVSDPPSPVIVADGPTTFCRGDSVTLSLQAGYASYLWSTGERSASITVHGSGSYSVEVTDANGCTGIAAAVTVVARPITPPRIVGPVTLCRSNSDAQEYSVVDEAGMEYAWSADGAASLTQLAANRVAIVWGAVSSGVVYVTKTETGVGCMAFDTLTVLIGDSLSPVVLADGQIPVQGRVRLCEGESAVLSVDGLYQTYAWSTGENTPTITVDAPGSYTVAVSDTTGCRGTSMPVVVEVLPLPLPVIEADGPLSFCQGDSVRLAVRGSYASYLWSTGATTPAIVVRGSGSYTVTVTSADGCTGTSSATTVTVTPPETHQVQGPSSVCVGEEAVYRDAVAGGGVSRTWTVTGPLSDPGVILSGQGSDEITVIWPGEGQGTVLMTMFDPQSGCTGEATRIVSVGTGITPAITAGGDPRICAGATIQLCTDAGDSYVWTPGGQTTQCIDVGAPGSYSVTVTRGSCSGTSGPFIVEAAPSPVPPVITPSRQRFCLGESAELDAGPGYASYAWLRDGQPTGDTTRRITVTPARGGSYRYSVVVTNPEGCSATSAEQVIDVFPPVTPVLTDGGAEVLCDPSGTTYRYQWYINDTLVPGVNADRIPIQRTGIYVVQITDGNGCSAWSDPLPVMVRVAATTFELSCPVEAVYPVGARVVLPVTLLTAQNLESDGVREMRMRLRYNPSVLSAGVQPVAVENDGDDRVITVGATRPADATQGAMIELPFTVLFGDSDCATVRIDSLWWTDGTARVDLAGAECEVCVEVCREGGTRLYFAEGRLNLAQNRPNPFNTTTLIEYEVIERGPTALFILDVMGRRVATLLEATLEPGRYVTRFDATGLVSGNYICVLQTPTQSVFKLMVLVK